VACLEEPIHTNDCAQSAAGVNEIPAGYLLSLALPPLDTLANTRSVRSKYTICSELGTKDSKPCLM
jgi:hypothetical protein